MRYKQFLPVAMLCAVVLVLSGCADNPADNTTPAETVAPFEASTTPAEGVTYTLAADTAVDFVGSKVTGSHEGGFKAVSGSVVVPGGNIEQAQIDVLIDMNSVWTDSERLTGHLKTGDFFEVEKFPEASFKSTSIAAAGEGYEVKGNLTLHGVTKGITFPAQITVSENPAGLTANAEFSIDRTQFDIVYAGKADDLIRPEVVIKFALNAK